MFDARVVDQTHGLCCLLRDSAWFCVFEAESNVVYEGDVACFNRYGFLVLQRSGRTPDQFWHEVSFLQIFPYSAQDEREHEIEHDVAGMVSWLCTSVCCC